MSVRMPDAIPVRLERAHRINETAKRIFVALRGETRAHAVTNDEVAQLLELAETLAAGIVDGTGGHARETHVIARACAALDAQRAATADLRTAITRVYGGIDGLLR